MTRDPESATVNDALNKLEEGGAIETEYSECDDEPAHSLTDEGQSYIERRLETSTEHQLVLLQVHWNMKCAELPTTVSRVRELFRFVAEFRDGHGVNLLRVLDENRDRFETDPFPEFAEPTLRRFDPYGLEVGR